MKLRADRVDIVSWHDIQCESLEPNFVLKSSDCLLNLSMSGLAFKKDKVLKTLDIGSLVRVRLALKGQGLETSFKIVRLNDFLVAGSFVKPSLPFLGALKNYFLVELAALRMSPVAPRFMKATEEGNPHWFESDQHASLYFIEKKHEILKFEMSLFGNVIEFNGNTDLKFGKRAIDFKTKAFEASRSHEWEKVWSVDTVDIFRRFIDSIPKLREADRNFFHKILTQIPTDK